MMKRDRITKAKAKAFSGLYVAPMQAIHAEYAELQDQLKAEASPALRLALLAEIKRVVADAETLQQHMRKSGVPASQAFTGLRAVKDSIVAMEAECLAAIGSAPLPGLPAPAQRGAM